MQGMLPTRKRISICVHRPSAPDCKKHVYMDTAHRTEGTNTARPFSHGQGRPGSWGQEPKLKTFGVDSVSWTKQYSKQLLGRGVIYIIIYR